MPTEGCKSATPAGPPPTNAYMLKEETCRAVVTTLWLLNLIGQLGNQRPFSNPGIKALSSPAPNTGHSGHISSFSKRASYAGCAFSISWTTSTSKSGLNIGASILKKPMGQIMPDPMTTSPLSAKILQKPEIS